MILNPCLYSVSNSDKIRQAFRVLVSPALRRPVRRISNVRTYRMYLEWWSDPAREKGAARNARDFSRPYTVGR